MPLIVPIVIIGANAVGIATGGFSGVRGGMKIRRGRRLVRNSLALHEGHLYEVQVRRAQVQSTLTAYGEQRLEASRRVLERAVRYLQSQGRFAELRDIVPLVAVPMSDEELPDTPNLTVSSKAATSALFSAAQGANAGPAALTRIAVQLGRASTGVAVKDLSGAAAKNASLAWLGGGAKAVGGGGMALGSAMGPLTAVGTAVTIAGLGANALGEQTLSKAAAAAADVDIAREALADFRLRLNAMEDRVDELSATLEHLTLEAERALDAVENLRLDDVGAGQMMGRALSLVAAVSSVLRTPVTAEGEDSTGSATSTATSTNEQEPQ